MVKEKKYLIGRAVNGITINGREFICDDNNKPMLFDSKDDARKFLRSKGIRKPEKYGIEILLDEDEDED